MKIIQKAIELDENEAEAHRIMGSLQMLCDILLKSVVFSDSGLSGYPAFGLHQSYIP
jgi:hypothetical protein